MSRGEHDARVPPVHREKLIPAFSRTAASVEYEYVESASHMIQYGFPLTVEQTYAYMTRIANYFSKNLSEAVPVVIEHRQFELKIRR